MNIKIRRSIFETNSSSTHSLTLLPYRDDVNYEDIYVIGSYPSLLINAIPEIEGIIGISQHTLVYKEDADSIKSILKSKTKAELINIIKELQWETFGECYLNNMMVGEHVLYEEQSSEVLIESLYNILVCPFTDYMINEIAYLDTEIETVITPNGEKLVAVSIFGRDG